MDSPSMGWTQLQAELSRMRTALEEIRAKRMPVGNVRPGLYYAGQWAAFNQCAAIAERALTAGSGK